MSSVRLRSFEEIEPGEVHTAGPYHVTRDEIVSFAQMYDPQPFHLDDEAGKASVLGGLAASGWHTVSIGMLLLFEAFVKEVESMGAPGVDEVRWLRPVHPGDDLSVTITIPAKRVSASRPDRGFVSVMLDLRNGAGEVVMTERFSMMVLRQGASQEIRAASPPPQNPGAALLVPPASLTAAALLGEIEIGGESDLGSEYFPDESIIAFAQKFDPQYFHTDPVRARESHFGGLAASGWQTAATWMKHHIAARARSRALREAQGLPCALAGPSPGFANMKWIRPVWAGETLSFHQKVTGIRPLTRPGWGMIESFNTARAADGAVVFSFEGRILWPKAI